MLLGVGWRGFELATVLLHKSIDENFPLKSSGS